MAQIHSHETALRAKCNHDGQPGRLLSMSRNTLFEKYYFSRPSYVSGTALFHQICSSCIPHGAAILEIGAGPSNPTTAHLASFGPVTGLDVSDEVLSNQYLREATVYNGVDSPFADAQFDACISNYVLEHVADPAAHFREVARNLKPGGVYCFRTPNRWHYVGLAASFLPHSMHMLLANRLRGLDESAHDPYPTVYRSNTRRQIEHLAAGANLDLQQLEMIEAEPSYGTNVLLFYPMLVYERVVNRFPALSGFRSNIVAVLTKRRTGPDLVAAEPAVPAWHGVDSPSSNGSWRP